MKVKLFSGDAVEVMGGNWVIRNINYSAGSSMAIYKATADTTLVFKEYWYVSAGTGNLRDTNIVAYVIGKE